MIGGGLNLCGRCHIGGMDMIGDEFVEFVSPFEESACGFFIKVHEWDRVALRN